MALCQMLLDFATWARLLLPYYFNGIAEIKTFNGILF